MRKKVSIKLGFVIILSALLFVSLFNPITVGYNTNIKNTRVDENQNMNNSSIDRYALLDPYSPEVNIPEQDKTETSSDNIETSGSLQFEKQKEEPTLKVESINAPLDSPWPMYCHDTHHTGRSPYDTTNTWGEIWRFKQHLDDYIRGSPVINDDTIYFGGICDFYALYPNGTMKWKYDGLDFYVWSTPAIDENGTIYFGDCHGYFYAIYPDGTKKWKRKFSHDIKSSPAIGEDGTIFFGDSDYYINAIYPNNGSVKWRYKTGLVVYSSPAIGDDGTIYCGSHDENLYAFYPNNGTVKWKYKTGHWVRVSPCIADDGTIYVVSLDGHLHAVNPDGTRKWKTNVGAGTSPTIGQDGTIYCGYSKLHAIYPNNGSVKWIFDVAGNIKGSTPCNSIDGTIYFGTSAGWLYAVNPDGTLKWREEITNEFIDSAPAIGKDGTVYVGSACKEKRTSVGYLHAFGIVELDCNANGPFYKLINKPIQFEGYAKGGYLPYTYHWDFGDGYTSDEQNPIHTYTEAGNYSITLTVTDNTSNTSIDTTWAWIQVTNTPPEMPTINGPVNGIPGTVYDYLFSAIEPDGNPIWYYIDWDDGENTGWIGPYSSGEQIKRSHGWTDKGTYIISCKAKDSYGNESIWGELTVTIPRNKATTNSFFLLFLERFPLLKQLFAIYLI